MSRVKAVCEASHGDIAKGRQTLMEVVKIGVLVMVNESYSVELSRKVGYAMASVALDTASQPLFVDGEERFRGELRNLYCRLLMNDVEYARLAAKRRLDECWRYIGENCTTNRAMMLGHMLAAGRTVLPQTDFSDLTWKGLERQFIAALLTAFPGYALFAPDKLCGHCNAYGRKKTSKGALTRITASSSATCCGSCPRRSSSPYGSGKPAAG